MKLRRIVSGGQTGADRTGLECAKALGLETGGKAPKGWKIDGGTDPSLADFGLTQSHSSDYAVRTAENVLESDATLWFGNMKSLGYWCTRGAADKAKRPFFMNPSDLQIEYICNTYETANIAGNRKRMNPDVVQLVQDAFKVIGKLRNEDFDNHLVKDKQ